VPIPRGRDLQHLSWKRKGQVPKSGGRGLRHLFGYLITSTIVSQIFMIPAQAPKEKFIGREGENVAVSAPLLEETQGIETVEPDCVPDWREQITLKELTVSVVLGTLFCIITHKLNLTVGIIKSLTVSAGMLGFFFVKSWTSFLSMLGVSIKPLPRHENAVIQTGVVPCYGLAFRKGFGSYLIALDEQKAELIGVVYPGTRVGDFKHPSLVWMIGFLFPVSFLGLFSLVPLHQVLDLVSKLPYPIGTTTPLFLINTGATLAGKHVCWPMTAMTKQRVVGQLCRVESTASYCLMQRMGFSPNCSTFLFVLKANPFLWTALIRGYAFHAPFSESIVLYNGLSRTGIRLVSFIFSAIFKTCGAVLAVNFGQQFHSRMILFGGFAIELYVGNPLIDMYVQCGLLDCGHKVFDEMAVKDMVAWTAMVTGYAQNASPQEALEFFEKLHDAGIETNDVTLGGFISAGAQLGADKYANWVWDIAKKYGFGSAGTVVVGSALIDMYSNFGSLVHG
jgi:pentatricopeptide repeat protein